MNQARLRKELRKVGKAGDLWGQGLFRAGRLPIDHSYIPRSDNTPRRQAIEECFHTVLFKGYMDAAEFAGQTRPTA